MYSSAAAAEQNLEPTLDGLMQTYRDGNYGDAYQGLRTLALNKDTPSTKLSTIVETAISSLLHLNRTADIDEFREQAVAAHPDDWRLLMTVAQSYINVNHSGFLIGGEFRRGPHRGGGNAAHATERDRVRALQLFLRGMEVTKSADGKVDQSQLLKQFADAVMFAREGDQAWRLQSRTNLEQLPDYEQGWASYGGGQTGAPVDNDGNPVFYDVPESWDDAQSDGERWRWLLKTMVEWHPARRIDEQLTRASFLLSQFGVQTMAEYRMLLARPLDEGGGAPGRPNTWALDTLTEDETIARLATGIKRFRLPDEHNFIKLFQQAATNREAGDDSAQVRGALRSLAGVFENRRQYPRAAEYWREIVEREKDPQLKQNAEARLQQIVGNWGQFENAMSQPAGQGATVEFRFRNARRVDFVAHEINVRKLLDDVKAYLKSNPAQLDWEKLNISDIGYRLIQENQQQYIGAEVANWQLELDPREKHFDRRVTVATPLQKAGAYLVTASVVDGNQSKIVLWLADTALLRKPLAEKSLYFVGDAVSGEPIGKVNVEFFAYRQRHIDGNRYQIDTKNSAATTDANGQALLPLADETKTDEHEFQWFAVATTASGRLAYLGFHNVWRAPYEFSPPTEIKTFAITDRPVYRPGQAVEFKFWIRQPQYALETKADEKSRFAHQSYVVEIHNPKGEKVYTQTLTTDNYGGLAGTYTLPDDATLGPYQLYVVNHGGGSFRVEEYKKPEFEVTIDAPSDPVMLGETIKATIRANYYFGSPVANATVKYKVLRSEHATRWFPPGPWDWLYGPGYWWFAPEYAWYPNWRSWGCAPPSPWWFWNRPAPPELVVEREATIRADGTLELEIDTSLAQAAHPDQDHRYTIQAEVVDQSRRTIVGSGEVLVARRPFQVFAWVDRGYYRIDDTITASFLARRLDGKPVQGSGKLRLLKISYGDAPERKPIETEVRTWELPTNADGQAEIQVKASEAGQYRLAYVVTDAAGHQIEGAYLFTIIGAGFEASEFRFNDLEIIPQRRHYAPGDKVELQINTNRIGSTVLLFLRPTNGVYLPPQMLKLKGKSTVVEFPVEQRDMPNFFVEAVTIAGAKVHTVAREIYVPPAKRILKVDLVPSSSAYQPGQRAKVKLKISDETGAPFVGSTVLSIYDKSVEYISGGSNVADIKKFFWDWRRQHRPHLETNLERLCGNLVPRDQKTMESLGIFGAGVADDELSLATSQVAAPGGIAYFAGAPGGGGGIASGMAREAPAAPAPQARAAMLEDANADGAMQKAQTPGEAALATPTIRTEFADTALWVAALETGKDGMAEVELDMPENLTTWKIRAWSMGPGTRVGEATAEVVTRKNIIVRMQAPRFFVETDEVVLSANVHNYLPNAKEVKIRLELAGNTIELPSAPEQTIEVPAGGERRVDWRVKAVREGQATLRMMALTDAESDAVEMKFPVYVHGMLKTESFTGVVRPDSRLAAFEVSIPAKRRAEQTRLEVRYSPTLAGAMVDALPYLADYPYGCTEQTLNRFLPAVITQKTLIEMGLNLKAIQEKRTNLNAQELGPDKQRAADWKRLDRNPVFDEQELSKMVKVGVNRLTEMQLSDGGWGWFSGWGERSTPHTTAVVVHGLQIAKQNDVALVPGVLERGIEWLKQYQAEQLRSLANVDGEGKAIDASRAAKHATDNLDALVYMVLVDEGAASDAMRDYLYRDRTKLAVYGLATYALALHRQQDGDKLAMVMRNLSQYVVEDDENQTAYLNIPEGISWYWYGSEFEAHAYYLKLLVARDPQDRVAPKIVKYLVNNRKHATYWNSTRDTALVVEALADYIQATGENKPDLTIEVWVDGQKRKEAKISAENLFTFDNAFVLAGDALAEGRHTIELRKTGSGPLYWNGYLTNFTMEDDIRRAGLELKVERRYYKLTPVDSKAEVSGARGQVVSQQVEKYTRTEIPNLGKVASGDLLEIELIVESKNDYEYIMLEDMKAAGCEPVALQSGYNGNELGAYMELRDNRVALFVQRLARGKHSISYRMRAETPGRFSALPTRASAMYAPELKANSDEMKLGIEDQTAAPQDD